MNAANLMFSKKRPDTEEYMVCDSLLRDNNNSKKYKKVFRGDSGFVS